MSGKDVVKNLKSKLDGDELDLSLSDLSVVPVKEIAALKKVAKLDLSSNQLVSLPDDFVTLKNLTQIDLSSNKLRSLPEQFGKLENLQRLDLYKNSLETLPVSLGLLKNLRWLDVKDNPLEDSLRKVAGDCLNEKQCAEAAKKVVQHMQKIYSDRERELQKDLKKKREVEAAERSKEEEASKAKAAEKKKEKERKKQTAKSASSKHHHDEEEEEEDDGGKESSKEAEKKRGGQREKGSSKQEKQAKTKKRRGCLGCIGCLFSLIFGLVFFVALAILGSAGFMYANCSRPNGKEFLPKTRPLCQDLYQMMQTGRVAPLTWDHKATIQESTVALQSLGNTAAAHVRNFDYVGWKNAAIDFALTTRDTIVRLAIWTYENGFEAAKPMLKQLVEWFWVALAIVVYIADRAFHYIVHYAQLTIEMATDLYNNFPAYVEKVKFYWKNMK